MTDATEALARALDDADRLATAIEDFLAEPEQSLDSESAQALERVLELHHRPIEQAAEAAGREAAGGVVSVIPSAAAAPLDVEALVQRLDAADQALKRHTLGMSLAVPEIGSPWWEREEAIRALCAYADAIRKRG